MPEYITIHSSNVGDSLTPLIHQRVHYHDSQWPTICYQVSITYWPPKASDSIIQLPQILEIIFYDVCFFNQNSKTMIAIIRHPLSYKQTDQTLYSSGLVPLFWL